jgi:surfeit locus 1 family protein
MSSRHHPYHDRLEEAGKGRADSATMPPSPEERTRPLTRQQLRRLLWPSITAIVMFVILIGLGTWQIQRLHWKEQILSAIDRAQEAPAVPLPAQPAPFMKVQVSGHLRADLSALYSVEVRTTPAGPELGAQLLEPLERIGAPDILVDRGWVPLKRAAPLAEPPGTVTIQGFVRPAAKPNWFTPADDVATRQFYTLDPARIGTALGLTQVAPFTLVALGPPPPERYPEPARELPRPPNNHLSYAITWYGLAAALLVIFTRWARQALGSAPSAG